MTCVCACWICLGVGRRSTGGRTSREDQDRKVDNSSSSASNRHQGKRLLMGDAGTTAVENALSLAARVMVGRM